MLADVIDRDSVLFRVDAEEKENVLRVMTQKLCESKTLSPSSEILDAILERERERSTGIERGLAVPHCRTSAVDEIYVSLAIIRDGIDWGSLDEKPAHFIFLVVGPNNRPEEYLKLLSQISRLMKSDSIRERLLNAGNPEEVIEVLKQD